MVDTSLVCSRWTPHQQGLEHCIANMYLVPMVRERLLLGNGAGIDARIGVV